MAQRKINNEVDDKIIEKINKKISSARNWGIFALIMGIGLGILFFFALHPFASLPFIVIGVVLAISIPNYVKSSQLKTYVVPFAVKKAFGTNAIYKAHGTISSSELKEMNVFRVYNLSQEDLIKAEYKGISFECADIKSYEIVNSGEDSHEVVYFDGMVLIMEFNKPFDGEVVIKENDYRAYRSPIGFKNSLEQFKTESMDFNKSYEAYATTQHLGFYVITPQLILKLNKIRSMIKGGFCFKFTSDKLYIAISGAKNELEGRKYKTIGKDVVDRLVKELDPIKTIIEELDLDSSYFRDVDKILKENKDMLKKSKSNSIKSEKIIEEDDDIE